VLERDTCFGHGIRSIHLWDILHTIVISTMVLIIILITDELKDVAENKISIFFLEQEG
jgi:hypothetical protein